MSAKRSGLAKQLIDQCCLAVVDVCDDGDIAQRIHGKRHKKGTWGTEQQGGQAGL
jgi:hypothetical protein